MNTKPIYEPSTVSIDISKVCEHYPDTCEFCDYNCSGWCSLYCVDVPEAQEEEK
ncbi:MAG: hypothetical protein RBT65_12625 [Methanolobus sp.]|nr:hypothetical protein [Methanolobus sp.]